MGMLQERYGMALLGRTPDGTCPLCAVNHDPAQPHNRDSLCYQYKFYDQNGRWPAWADAMAHCTPEIQAFWKRELSARGVEIGEVSE